MLKRLASVLPRKREVQILIVGLDNSGKSSLVAQMKPKKKKSDKFEATPTVGFQVDRFQYQNIMFTTFDMSGQSKYRGLWETYYGNVEAIVFVVDASDKIRMCVAKDELEELLKHDVVHDHPIPMLFFANKMDLDDAMTPAETAQILELDRISDRPWHVAACNALTGFGIPDGIAWLAENLSGRHK